MSVRRLRPLVFGAILGSASLAPLVGCSAPDSSDGPSDSDDGGLDGVQSTSLLPARIRRLTNAEYDATVAALLGTSLTPAADFTPDARQHGYTVNEAQRVDPVLARQLDAAAVALAAEAKARLDQVAPCADPAGGGEACANDFIRSFGSKAYRRPLEQEDVDGLLGLYRIAAEGATYADGIELVIRGILQSPGFLYHTEIGAGGVSKDNVALTPYEVAESLSYLITGGPPDAELLAAAESGEIQKRDVRAEQVRRLFTSSLGGARAVRVVREWLGIDRIATTAKDSTIYPDYAQLKDSIERETEGFVKEVFATTPGTVGDLLGADWTVADGPLLAMYGGSGEGRAPSPRKGLLNQAAFLSVYAHAHETGPVLRGTTVLRRVACIDIALPTSLDVVIVPPVPDPAKTTRERFEIHAADRSCASCHDLIDPLGFSFEQFDGMGAHRATENGKPVDSATTVAIGYDFDGSYTDSTGLAAALAASAEVRDCFARQVFRASAGEGSGLKDAEATFMEFWAELPEETRGSLLETLDSFAESSLFTHRRPQ